MFFYLWLFSSSLCGKLISTCQTPIQMITHKSFFSPFDFAVKLQFTAVLNGLACCNNTDAVACGFCCISSPISCQHRINCCSVNIQLITLFPSVCVFMLFLEKQCSLYTTAPFKRARHHQCLCYFWQILQITSHVKIHEKQHVALVLCIHCWTVFKA